MDWRKPIVQLYGDDDKSPKEGSVDSQPSRVVAKRILPIKMRFDLFTGGSLINRFLRCDDDEIVWSSLISPALSFCDVFNDTACTIGFVVVFDDGVNEEERFRIRCRARLGANKSLFRMDRYSSSSIAGLHMTTATIDVRKDVTPFRFANIVIDDTTSCILSIACTK
jgi:hypothetical protein